VARTVAREAPTSLLGVEALIYQQSAEAVQDDLKAVEEVQNGLQVEVAAREEAGSPRRTYHPLLARLSVRSSCRCHSVEALEARGWENCIYRDHSLLRHPGALPWLEAEQVAVQHEGHR
jgi:hypothetical protein